MLCFACSKGEVEQSNETQERQAVAVLTTDSVSTLISDSGITRYRIEAPQWLVYDKTEPPYQEFPKGVYLEQFDAMLAVQASLKADYAYYDEQAQLWELRGNVRSMNADSEFFETPQLFWNQKTERIYSDSTISITREASIIKGIGFQSNQELTKYTILNPTGVFPIKDE
jgi:LPS export ABC transporter protein LptC